MQSINTLRANGNTGNHWEASPGQDRPDPNLIFYTGDCSDKDRASATVKCVPIVRINGQLVI